MDPLRPFADLIRSLSQTQTRDTATSPSSSVAAGARATASNTKTSPQRAERPLKLRIKERISQAGNASPAKLRELFVETVLLAELGEHLAKDPAFGDLVARVAQQLHSDATSGARLDELLAHMSGS